MSRIRYIKEIHRFYVLWEDGSKGFCSQRAVEDLWSDRDWDVVKEKPNQWFYI